MIKNEEASVLHEIHRNTRMAEEAIDTVLNKVYDEDLAYDLHCQAQKYKEIEGKAEQAMNKGGVTPRTDSKMEKAMLWSSIQMNTLLNTSTSHVAEMVIQGNTRGITELMKAVHNNKVKGSYANELASELMDFEEKNIEKLKSYL